MKKIFLFIAAITAIVGCQKSDLQQEVFPNGQTLTALAPGAGQNTDTKVSFKEDGLVTDQINAKWEVGDVITIYKEANGSYENNGNWQVHNVSGDGKATFTISSDNNNPLSDNSTYCAVYPASTAATLADWDNETIYGTAINQSDKYQTQTGNDNMSHLDDKLKMKTQPFSSNEAMIFEHQASIMTLEFKQWEKVSTVAFVDNLNASDQRYYVIKFDNNGEISYKMHFMINANSSTNHKIAFQSVTSSNYYEKTANFAFVAGKHYIWETNPTMPTGVTLDNSSIAVAPGSELQLTATVLPEEVRNKNVTWESNNTSVATVDENGLVTVEEGCAVGSTATITAASKLDNTKFATCEITVGIETLLTLATIDPYDLPDSDIWTFTDTDDTAGSMLEFRNLRIAMDKVAADKFISINFPNLTKLPEKAMDSGADYTPCKAPFKISAPNVTTIGPSALSYINKLEVDMRNLEIAGNSAFYRSGITSFNFPKLTEIGNAAFSTTKIAGALTIPGDISVGLYAFSICTELTSLSMPDVTTISVGLVSNCTKLETLSLPKVNKDAVYGRYDVRYLIENCTALTKIEIATTQKVLFDYHTFKINNETGCNNIDLITHADNIATENGDALYYETYLDRGMVGYYNKGPFKSITTP